MKTVELRGNHDLERVIQNILVSNQEELIVAFGKTAETSDGLIFLVKEIGLGDESYISRSMFGLKWDARLTAQWIGKAETEKYGIALIHAHPGGGKVGFSSTDLSTKERILKHFDQYLKGLTSGYIVVGDDDFVGEFVFDGKNYALDVIRSVGVPIYLRRKLEQNTFTPSPNHHRQELAFGKKANQLLRNTIVGVVGLGGAGSMVVEQLAHLKVGKIILIDGDTLEDSNLSRVVGSKTSDIGINKVDIAARLINDIDPTIEIVKITDYAPTSEIYNELKKATVIVGCVDKIPVKAALNNFSKRYITPLIDIGVTIRPGENFVENINGQIVRINPDGRCLKCYGIISAALESQQAIDDYGAKTKNPQVITYNGVLASLALGEMIKIVTGIGPSDDMSANLSYDGLTGEIIRIGAPDYICDVCKSQYAQGDPRYS